MPITTSLATTVPSTPERTCTAEVVVFEDASWLGTSLVLDGKQVAARWEVAGPELQGRVIDGIAYTAFPATWHGVPCTQVMP